MKITTSIPGRSHWTIRRPPRHRLSLPCQVVRERDFKLVGSEILDVSEWGMLVRCNQRVLTGESLVLSFQAPFSRHWVDAEGVVARVVHGRRPMDDGKALGVSFDTIDEVSRALIRRNTRHLPPNLPKRRVLALS